MRMLSLSLCVLRSPVNTFEAMKADRKNFRFWPIFALMLALVITRIAYIFLVHYPMSQVDPDDANLITELAYYLLPAITFAVANFGVTSILDGETKMGESLMAVMYSMMPIIIMQLPMAAFSHIVDQTDGTIFYLLEGVIWVWVIALAFTSIKVLNHYSLSKTLIVMVADILATLLIWAVCLLLYALANQVVLFVDGIVREVRFAFGG